MTVKTLLGFVREKRFRLMLGTMRRIGDFYRLSWLASAARQGVLRALADGPRSFDRLARELSPDPRTEGALRAWLQVGVRLGELESGRAGFALRGFMARRLAEERHDPVSAFIEEVVQLHHSLLLQTPELLRRGQLWGLEDQDGVLVARSSRTVEPVVFEAIDRALPRSGPLHLLEVGAGSGTYIRYAAQRNSQLTALGLELQPEVAEVASANIREWGLGERARIEKGDVRDRSPEPVFDLVTLHNNIYYFAVEERVRLLQHLRCFLRPGGRLLLTTGCQGGSLATELLNLWSASTQGCGRLPEVEEMQEQMRSAGLSAVNVRSLLPGDRYFAFTATEPD
jgi:SAM-dependent methyltransferase